jgi:hypothetical protein
MDNDSLYPRGLDLFFRHGANFMVLKAERKTKIAGAIFSRKDGFMVPS